MAERDLNQLLAELGGVEKAIHYCYVFPVVDNVSVTDLHLHYIPQNSGTQYSVLEVRLNSEDTLIAISEDASHQHIWRTVLNEGSKCYEDKLSWTFHGWNITDERAQTKEFVTPYVRMRDVWYIFGDKDTPSGLTEIKVVDGITTVKSDKGRKSTIEWDDDDILEGILHLRDIPIVGYDGWLYLLNLLTAWVLHVNTIIIM